MSESNTALQTGSKVNGINVDQVMNVIGEIEADSEYAKFQFRSTNQWLNGSINRSTIKDFYAGKAEDDTRKRSFTLDADEPPIAAGSDTAPNSVEYVLHALGSCLTGTLVYHAAVRGIEIESIESSYRGNIDVRGLFGLADVRKGFTDVHVDMRVKSQASEEELTELALFSPVYEMISGSLPVTFSLTTYVD